MSREEEILKSKWGFESDPGRFSLAEVVILPAMREYAREKSIGFKDFLIKNGYIMETTLKDDNQLYAEFENRNSLKVNNSSSEK